MLAKDYIGNNFLDLLKLKFKATYKLKYLFLSTKTLGLVLFRNLFIILMIDTLLIDEEPLWEPLEWTLVQTWVMLIFFFSWAAEILISSAYGSFTGRDKRVYLGLYRSFWFAQMWMIFNLFVVLVFIIVPFYFEVYYNISYVVTWWNWFNSTFFFKTVLCFSVINILTTVAKLAIRWISWKKLFLLYSAITLILFYLLLTQLILTYFSFTTDINLYKKVGWMEYSNLSQGPLKWGWGSEGRDFFYPHGTSESFWFKNDSAYGLSFFLISFFFKPIVLIFIITEFDLFKKTLLYKGRFTYITNVRKF